MACRRLFIYRGKNLTLSRGLKPDWLSYRLFYRKTWCHKVLKNFTTYREKWERPIVFDANFVIFSCISTTFAFFLILMEKFLKSDFEDKLQGFTYSFVTYFGRADHMVKACLLWIKFPVHFLKLPNMKWTSRFFW